MLYESLRSARQKYKNKIDIHIFDRFIKADLSKTFKYVEKMCEIYTKYNLDPITVISIFRDYQKLENYIIGKDLTHMSLDDILNVIDEATIKRNLSRKNKRLRDQNEFLIYDENGIKIYYINSFEAAKSKCKSTAWCIGLNQYEFEHYNNYYDIFIIENKNLNDKFRKICYLKNDETEMIVDKDHVHYFNDSTDFKSLKDKYIPHGIIE